MVRSPGVARRRRPARGGASRHAGRRRADDRIVAELFAAEGTSLVRLARLFVDDRNAAEDLVQEAFIRLPATSTASRTRRGPRPTCVRSCSTWLATRTAAASSRCATASRSATIGPGLEDEFAVREDQREVLAALRDCRPASATCLVLRYYDELGPDEIASTLGISRNSVKTHLQRGLAALEARLTDQAAS